jgi:hypothetical protein
MTDTRKKPDDAEDDDEQRRRQENPPHESPLPAGDPNPLEIFPPQEL